MSATTIAGVVLIVVSVATVGIVLAMFVWGAREDGREQRRIDDRLRRGRSRR